MWGGDGPQGSDAPLFRRRRATAPRGVLFLWVLNGTVLGMSRFWNGQLLKHYHAKLLNARPPLTRLRAPPPPAPRGPPSSGVHE